MEKNISIQEKKQIIKSHPFFALLEDNDIDVLVRLLDEIFINKNNILVKENDPIDYIYIIVDGQVEATRLIETMEGRISILLAKLGSGDIVGASDVGFFSRTTLRSETVKALTNVILLRLDVIEFSMFTLNLSVPYLNLSTSADQIIKANFIKKLHLNWSEKIIFDHLGQMCDRIQLITFQSNESIFRVGDADANVYLLMRGVVNILDEKKIVQRVIKPKEIFGEPGMLDLSMQVVTAVAAEESTILKLSKQDMLNYVHAEIGAITNALNEAHILKKNNIDSYKMIAVDSQPIYILLDESQKYFFVNSVGWFAWDLINNQNDIRTVVWCVHERFNQIKEEDVIHFIHMLISRNLVN